MGELAHEVPTFIGTKDTGLDVKALKAILRKAPDLAIFGGEDFYEKLPAGGRGGYCSITGFNAPKVVELYALCAAGRLKEAKPLANSLRRFLYEALLPLVQNEGLMDSAVVSEEYARTAASALGLTWARRRTQSHHFQLAPKQIHMNIIKTVRRIPMNVIKTVRHIVALVFSLSVLTLSAMAEVAEENAASADGFYFPSTGVTVGRQAVLLAIDDYLLPQRENVGVYLSKPSYRNEPVLAPSKDNPMAPDQVAASFYGTILNDNGRFRMWYYGMRLNKPGNANRADMENIMQGPVCYAESEDGIRWHKPSLGQVEIRGSKDNNAIRLPDLHTQAPYIIKDEDSPDPQRRYKMVYNAHTGGVKGPVPEFGTWVMRTATSPDGFNWKAAKDYATDQFIEAASFYWFNGLYVVNGQRILPSNGGHPGGRQGRAISAVNFDEPWLPGDTGAFLLPEPADPAQRGQTKPYDQVHLGVGATSLGNVVIGLYGLWHNEEGDYDAKKRWSWFGYGKTSCDLGLVISNDGLHFREPVKGHVFMSRFDTPATPVPGKNFPTILCQSGNAILNVGNETRIYFGRWLNADYGMGMSVEVALATLPRDRWGALGLFPKDSPRNVYRDRGSVWSAPVRLPASGCEIVLNADHANQMTIEVSDAKFQLLPAYSGARSGKTAQESGLDCAVAWPEGNVSALGGKTVRFKINFKKEGDIGPRLFAVYLRTP